CHVPRKNADPDALGRARAVFGVTSGATETRGTNGSHDLGIRPASAAPRCSASRDRCRSDRQELGYEGVTVRTDDVGEPSDHVMDRNDDRIAVDWYQRPPPVAVRFALAWPKRRICRPGR